MQVRDLLEDRKQATLGYRPETASAAAATQPPTKQAYAAVPVTRLPPPDAFPNPIAPQRAELPFGPHGPEMQFPAGMPLPDEAIDGRPIDTSGTDLNLDTIERRATRTFRLGPPAPGDVAQALDLFGALRFAANHSRAYQDRMEDLYLAALDVTLERYLIFDPRPFAGGGLQYTGGQRDVNYRSALAATGAAGVRQRLPYGGEVVAEGLVSFVNALSDSAQSGESAELVLSGSIPLLRGAGLVNLEGVISSERELVYAVRDFERFRREFAVNVSAAYFRLLSRQARVNNRRINLANTTQLLDRTKALYAAGRQRFIEVQRAAGQVLTAENALITAQELYRNELDDFKVLLGMAVDTELDIVPVQLDVRVPDIANQDVLALANTYRLDLQTAKDRIEDARRAIANAENALLPELNLAGRTSVGNRPQTPAARLDGRSLEYQAGVTLDLPVDRVAERNAYRRATIAFQRATRQFDGERDNAAADVRAAARGIRAAEATVQIQERAVGVATNRLEYANELLRQGAPNITARDVVEAQTALLTAQDALDEARADLQTEILRYLRDTGTLRLDPQAGAIARALERDPANNPPATP